jgi:hypothetical protein
VCKKETRESVFWLKLVWTDNKESLEVERTELIQEGGELSKIFWSIAQKEPKIPKLY